jgi:hypothetical protein
LAVYFYNEEFEVIFLNVYDALGKVLGTKTAGNLAASSVPMINPALSTGVIIAGATIAEGIKLNAAAKLGPITSGRLSDMTDGVGLSPGITKMLNGSKDKEENKKTDDGADKSTNESDIFKKAINKGTEKLIDKGTEKLIDKGSEKLKKYAKGIIKNKIKTHENLKGTDGAKNTAHKNAKGTGNVSKEETPEFIKDVAKKLSKKDFKGDIMDSAVSGQIVLALHNLR